MVRVKQMFIAAETMKENVLPVFPTSLLDLRHFRNLCSAIAQTLLDFRPGRSVIPVPGKSPHDPASVIDGKSIIGEILLPRRADRRPLPAASLLRSYVISKNELRGGNELTTHSKNRPKA
jgi:hypothetical protein